MKNALTALFFFALGLSQVQAEWRGFTRVEGGISTLSDSMETGSALGVQVGAANRGWDIAYGYERLNGRAKALDGDLTLSTLGVEVGKFTGIPGGFGFRPFVGAGFTIPHLDSQDGTRIDNGISYGAGGELSYFLTNNLSIGIRTKYYVFHADSHRDYEESATETLLVGGVPAGTVETVEARHQDNSLNFNALNVTAALNWRF